MIDSHETQGLFAAARRVSKDNDAIAIAKVTDLCYRLFATHFTFPL